MKRFILILGITLSLQGCIFVVGAAAGAAAVAVVYDHRTIEHTLEDSKLANTVSENIKSNPNLKNESHVNVTAFNNVVLLTGETPNSEWKEQAGTLAQSAAGNAHVYNQITIQGPTSALTRTSDSWITTKIKTQMLTIENLKSSSIKVITENGTVYLIGTVTREQADIAIDIARQVSGVQKVMKIFQYR
jgi:osmotically-inducible protein OsmY